MRKIAVLLFALCLVGYAVADQYTVDIDGTTYNVSVTGGLVYGNENVYNVKSAAYGAKGDGTTDDTSAIQAALNAAMAGGVDGTGTVYLPPGRYVISNHLNVGHDPGIRIIGDRNGGTWLEAAAALDTSFIDIGLTASGYYGSAAKTNNTEIANIRFNNEDASTLDAFIRVGDGRSLWFHDLDFRDANDGTGSGGALFGIYQSSVLGDSIGVSFSVFERIFDSGAGAVDSSMFYCDYLVSSTIRDIRVSKNATYGVMLGGYQTCAGNSIHNINAESGSATNTALVYLDHSAAAGGTIRENHFYDLYGAALVDYGVFLVSDSGGHIYNNTIDGPGNLFATGLTNIVDNQTYVYLNRYNGLGLNAGDPSSTGKWFEDGFPGARVYDTTDGGFYEYANGSWRRIMGSDNLTASADDVTPTVMGASILSLVENTGATAITQLDDGVAGQVVTLLGTSATNSATISDGGNFVLKAASWTAGVDSVLTVITTNGTTWREISR